MEKKCPYGFGKVLDMSYEEALEKTRKALQEQGFGILTEIDVREKFKEKLNKDFRPYIILGACNPSFAHQALQAEINLGLLLPCNVIVYSEDENRTAVMAMDPVEALNVVGNPEMEKIAGQVKEHLSRALDAVFAQRSP